MSLYLYCVLSLNELLLRFTSLFRVKIPFSKAIVTGNSAAT
jgi:hypothetical protein